MRISSGRRTGCRPATVLRDGTAFRNKVVAQVVAQDRIGVAVGIGKLGVRIHGHEGRDAVGAADFRPLTVENALDPRIFGVDRDVTAAVREVHAPGAADAVATIVAAIGNTALRVEFETFVIALEDEVDDPGNGV